MKRIGIFCTISFGLTYLIAFTLMFNGGASNPLYTIGILVCMLTPALAHILTRLITKEGFKGCYLRPNFKKTTIKYYLLGWLGTEALLIIGGLVYYLIYPKAFDPSLSTMSQMLTQQAAQTGVSIPSFTPAALWGMLISQLIAGLTLGIVLNLPTIFGEEFGWRAYLLPKLVEEKGVAKALIYSGIIWGLWHAPIIAMGHNYGLHYPLFPIPGILGMVLFCIVVGIFFNYITLRTQSVWPAVMGHAVMNATAATMFLMHSSKIVPNPFIGPSAVGVIGGSGFIVVAIFLFRKLTKPN
ncbi:MAG: CPBP family intramembrane glutamic endopeptidase [Cellulosilyticaceae bacterium]